jgi:hypothetical protein
MAQVMPTEEQTNYETFRECLSEPVLRSLAAPVEKPKRKRRHAKKSSKSSVGEDRVEDAAKSPTDVEQGNDAEDLGEFIDVRISS